MPGSTPSFLVINVARSGDTLLAPPAMRALSIAYPGCAITAQADPKRAEVLRELFNGAWREPSESARVGRASRRLAYSFVVLLIWLDKYR